MQTVHEIAVAPILPREWEISDGSLGKAEPGTERVLVSSRTQTGPRRAVPEVLCRTSRGSRKILRTGESAMARRGASGVACGSHAKTVGRACVRPAALGKRRWSVYEASW